MEDKLGCKWIFREKGKKKKNGNKWTNLSPICHYSCLQWNRLPHLVNSVTLQTGEWWIWSLLMSCVDTQDVISIPHSRQNKLHGTDRESKHKHRLTGRFPGWNLRRRWNNLRGATSRKKNSCNSGCILLHLPFTSPRRVGTNLNSNILSNLRLGEIHSIFLGGDGVIIKLQCVVRQKAS